MSEARPTVTRRLRSSPRPETERRTAPPRWWRENLEHSLPVLIVGGALVGLSVWLAVTAPHGQSGHLPLWPLVLAIGLVLAGSGAALTLVDETGEAGDDDRFVRVDRADWERLQSSRRTPAPWDESTISPAAPAAARAPAPAVPRPRAPAPAPQAASPSAAADDMVRELSALLASEGPSPPAPAAALAPSPISSLTPPKAASAPFQPASPAATRPPDPPAKPLAIPPPWSEAPAAPNSPAEKPGPAECAGCGEPTESWAESCVTCDRPLCSDCQNESFSEGRPGLCPSCDRTRRSIDAGSG